LSKEKTSDVECFQMIAPLFAATVLAASLGSPIKQFRLLEKRQLPGTFLQNLCGRSEERKGCLEDFNKDGAVWAGDVNDDGVDEFIIDPGGMPGTLGPARFLVRQKGDEWDEFACLGGPEERAQDCASNWNTLRARFDILPVVRQGFHDLRIEVDHCLKWDGKRYIDYDSEDYARLELEWFDTGSSKEAELFWKIRYAGRKSIQFEPLWFTVSPQEFNRPPQSYMGFPVRVVEFPKLPYVSRRDLKFNIRWLSFFKGGVWGVRGNQAFLLVPQPSYLGAQRLELRGDWLLIYGELEEPDGHPDIRYNRRTHEIRFEN
jgi:hypothetical protein